jgi:hypothetical protein
MDSDTGRGAALLIGLGIVIVVEIAVRAVGHLSTYLF